MTETYCELFSTLIWGDKMLKLFIIGPKGNYDNRTTDLVEARDEDVGRSIIAKARGVNPDDLDVLDARQLHAEKA